MTPTTLLILAVLLQGTLILSLLYWLGVKRLPLVAAKKIRISDIALSKEPWPADAKQAGNAFDNQFQLPMLLFVATGIAIYLGASWIDATLALLFVLSRIAHALIFITSNHVIHRFALYVAGFVILSVWWTYLFVRLAIYLPGAT